MKKNDPSILVVDNSPVMRRIIGSVLEKEGYSCQMAEDGLQAIDFMEESRPDIIFTDLIMPKIDGEKLSLIVRNTPAFKDIFLVILSGVAMEDDINVTELGADVCIAKGPASTMRTNVLAAIEQYHSGERGNTKVQGMNGLYRREVTSELLVSKQHRDIVLARMTEGVLELNHQGRIVMINSAAVTLLGSPETQLLGDRFADFTSSSEKEVITDWVQELEATSPLAPLIFSYDDPVVINHHQVTVNLVPVAENGQIFIIAILGDVTHRKEMELRQRQLEKELQRISKLDAMSQMASGIAHDFNNLLTIITGNIEMARYVSEDPKVGHLLDESGKALDLTTSLIRKFTTFSDNYLPQKSLVQLTDLIRTVISAEIDQDNITSQINAQDNSVEVFIDPVQMQQVFHNLLNNSVDAIGSNAGSITVSIEQVDGREEAEHTGQPIPAEDLIRVTFMDSGPGISDKLLYQVFDPYFSTKQKGAQKGMGLGLTIIHSTMKKHGGFVWIDGQSKEGCVVYLYFPLIRGDIVTDPIMVERVKPNKRVLVMDDEEMMRVVNKKMFEHFGCEVAVAEEGQQAVELFKKGIEDNCEFDLVLLDLNVEDGMSGVDASREILHLQPEACLVALSGDPGNEVLLNYAEHNFVAALAKPFSIDTVEDLVRRMLM